MRFVTVRDLRSKSAQVWRKLSEEGDLVITSKGRPIAVVSATDEAHLEQTLRRHRQARAASAVSQLQQQSLKAQRRLSPKQIEAEIQATRKARRR
ncbi:MAG: type II toxin-antitoxin system prevent-host-death family antitoxin [Planctomycetaceae bacterium]|nr:type II toxin-antitoxin system prevent-host-death family antitoxin [Planctomycetaceae bacterium]